MDKDNLRKMVYQVGRPKEEELYEWPCQVGGTGAGIYGNVDGKCQHPECHPNNDDCLVV